MTDCANADIRDRLPDLLHERLDAPVRAEVVAHLETCGDCRAELELLRGVHKMLMARTPRVDVARIVAALPAPSRARPAARWVSWRLAAAVTLLAVGGTSLAVIKRSSTSGLAPVAAPVVAQTPTPAPASAGAATQPVAAGPTVKPAPRVDRPTTVAAAPAAESTDSDTEGGLAMTGRLGELSDSELRTLLSEIERLEAVPLAEPDPVVIPVTAKRSRPRQGA